VTLLEAEIKFTNCPAVRLTSPDDLILGCISSFQLCVFPSL